MSGFTPGLVPEQTNAASKIFGQLDIDQTATAHRAHSIWGVGEVKRGEAGNATLGVMLHHNIGCGEIALWANVRGIGDLDENGAALERVGIELETGEGIGIGGQRRGGFGGGLSGSGGCRGCWNSGRAGLGGGREQSDLWFEGFLSRGGCV